LTVQNLFQINFRFILLLIR